MGPIEQLRAGRLAWRLPQLLFGLLLYGLSSAMLLLGTLGNTPWDVLHQGVAGRVGLSIGTVGIGTSMVVLLLWIPLRELPGLGTVLNSVLVGLATNLGLAMMAPPGQWWWRVSLMIGGIVLNAVATAMYIGSQFGPGPRDGLMTAFHRRTGASIRLVRTLIEVTVVALGWLLGGVFGLGTVLYAISIGPLTQLMLPWFIVPLPSPGESSSAAGGDHH